MKNNEKNSKSYNPSSVGDGRKKHHNMIDMQDMGFCKIRWPEGGKEVRIKRQRHR